MSDVGQRGLYTSQKWIEMVIQIIVGNIEWDTFFSEIPIWWHGCRYSWTSLSCQHLHYRVGEGTAHIGSSQCENMGHCLSPFVPTEWEGLIASTPSSSSSCCSWLRSSQRFEGEMLCPQEPALEGLSLLVLGPVRLGFLWISFKESDVMGAPVFSQPHILTWGYSVWIGRTTIIQIRWGDRGTYVKCKRHFRPTF